MNTPILFLIFNRPDTSQKVFDSIRDLKPKYLYVAADGPREGRLQEVELCRQTRDIISQVDWDCNIKTLYRKTNLGCGIAVSSAIEWFFQNVEYGIILEDDCLPHPSFFPFCEELLELYKDDTDIMLISGNNFQKGMKRGLESYYFSNYSHIWGWASWRRAWIKYDYDMKAFPEFLKEKKIKNVFSDYRHIRSTLKTLKRAFRKKYNTWDYQWNFTIWENNGLCIIPNCNLVTNIGFDLRGTHTHSMSQNKYRIPYAAMQFPLVHPQHRVVNRDADYFTYYNFIRKPIIEKVILKLREFLIKIK